MLEIKTSDFQKSRFPDFARIFEFSTFFTPDTEKVLGTKVVGHAFSYILLFFKLHFDEPGAQNGHFSDGTQKCPFLGRTLEGASGRRAISPHVFEIRP